MKVMLTVLICSVTARITAVNSATSLALTLSATITSSPVVKRLPRQSLSVDNNNLDDDERCPKRPVFMIAYGGRTRNWIIYYVSTLLIGRHLFLANGQIPYTHRYIRQRVMDIFENNTRIFLPIVDDIPQHRGVNWRHKTVSMYTLYNTEQLEAIYKTIHGEYYCRKGWILY